MSATQGTLGCLEKKVTKACRDWMAFLEPKESQAFLGNLAPWAQLARKGSRAVMESQGQQERKANQVYQEEESQGFPGPKETKVQRAMWASQDWPGVQAFLDPKESQASQVLRGLKDSQDCPEPQAVLWRGPKETEGHRDSLACQDFRDPWGLQGSLDWMD